MRAIFLVLLLLAPGAAVGKPSAKDQSGAKAANVRGLTLAKKKQYKEAEAEYRKAIALDPGMVVAHYNLACAAWLADDADVAFLEIAWISNRAAWDDQARAAVKAAHTDPDLKTLLNNWTEADQWLGAGALETTDLLKPVVHGTGYHALTAQELAPLKAALAAAPGPHAAECSAGDARQGRVLGEQLPGGKEQTAVATLRDGLGLIDASGKLLARSEPLGCTAEGASQDQLGALAYVDARRDQLTGMPPIPDHFFVVQYSNGGKQQWSTSVALFARKDDKLIRVFEGVTSSSDLNGAGKLDQTSLGDLIYQAPGDKTKHVLLWDQATFKFAPL